MKDSGVAWIGQVPVEWEVERLQWHIKELNDKNTPIVTTNVLSLTNDKGVIPYKDRGNQGNKAKEDYSEYKLAYENTIIANSMNILIGSVGLSKYNGCVSPVYYIFKNRENTSIDFLNYLFQMRQFQRELRKYANGILEIRLRVSATDIMKRMVAFPPLAEQKRIAKFLDEKCGKIDELSEKIKAQIEKLEAYKKSLITEAVTKGVRGKRKMKDSGIAWIGQVPVEWEVGRVKYLATEENTIFTDGDWINSDVIVDEGIRYLTSGNVGDGIFKRQGAGYITEETFNELNCLTVLPGDLMISRLNEPIGRACIVPEGEPFYVCAVDNVIIRPDKRHDKEYLMFAMSCPQYHEEALNAAAGTTMKRISRINLGRLSLPWPPLAEQKRIADWLDKKCGKVDEIIAKRKVQLEKLAEYKKSLIYEYVTGKKEVAA